MPPDHEELDGTQGVAHHGGVPQNEEGEGEDGEGDLASGRRHGLKRNQATRIERKKVEEG